VQLLLASCNKRQQLGQTFENSLMAAVGSKDLWPSSRKPVMKMLTYHKHQRTGNRSIVMATAAGQPHNPDQQSQPESQQTFDQLNSEKDLSLENVGLLKICKYHNGF